MMRHRPALRRRRIHFFLCFVLNRSFKSRAFFSDFPCVASCFLSFGLAAGSPPSLRDGACSARIDPYTVFALAPVANRLKNALACSSSTVRSLELFLEILEKLENDGFVFRHDLSILSTLPVRII